MNVILIISDTFRHDNLYGTSAMPVRTPELSRFAERAVGATQMITGSFPTIPHRTDLTTGRFGWPWYGWQDRLLSSPNHLPELLGRAGYVTQLLCDCPHLFRSNFHVGFDAAHAIRGQEADLHLLRMNYPIESVMPPEKTRTGHHFQGRIFVDLARWENRNWRLEADCLAPQTARLAVEFLEENYRHDPFFVWVDFFDPHEPWDAPEYLVRRYDPDYAGVPMLHPNYGKASDLTPEELRNLRAHYCAEAELVDRSVGRVLQKIDDLGLWDNSIVVFTSDHGMSLGEHNRTGKSNINDRDERCWPLYPEIARVPCLIAAPGLAGGRTVDAVLQPPDIVPTILDLAGLDVTPPQPFHGQSFAPMLRGEAQPAFRDCAVCGCHLRRAPDATPTKWQTPVIYAEQWAYVPIGPEGQRELYDLSTDPYAETNIIAAHPQVADALQARLVAWLKQHDAPAEAISACAV